MKLGATLLFLIFSCLSYANAADSLYNICNDNTVNPHERLKALSKYSFSIVANYPDSSMTLAELGIRITSKTNETNLLAHFWNTKATALLYQGDLYNSIHAFETSMKIYESIGMNPVWIYSNLGAIHYTNNDFESAIPYFQKSFKHTAGTNLEVLAQINHNIGASYNGLKDYDKALTYLKETVDYRIELGQEVALAMTYTEMSKAHLGLGNLIPAKEYIKKASRLASSEDYYSQLYISIGLTEIANENQNYKDVTEHAKNGIFYADELENIHGKVALLERLYKAYEKNNQIDSAFFYFDYYIEVKDSIERMANVKKMTEKFLNLEHEKENELREQAYQNSLVLEQEKQEKQKIIITAFIIGITITVFLLIFLFNRFKIISKQKDTIEEKNKEITDSINYAKRIQKAILPTDQVIASSLPECFILYQPKDIVAGDFYWLEQKAGQVFFAVADCTGHGVPGAMVSVVCNNALNRSVREHGMINPGEILDKTKEIVIEEFEKSTEEVKDGMDIALIRLSDMKLSFAGAYNPLWILRNKEIIIIKGDKAPIGKSDRSTNFTTHEVDLQKGDCIYLFSDGYPDQFGGNSVSSKAKGGTRSASAKATGGTRSASAKATGGTRKSKKFMSKRLKALLISIGHLPMEKQKDHLQTAFNEWKGVNEQVDDVCMAGIRI